MKENWDGKFYDYILTFKKYYVNWKQYWTDYKKWGDFNGKWMKQPELYYTEEDMLKEIRDPCYKFLWWEISKVEWWWQCDKVRYVRYVDFYGVGDIRFQSGSLFFSPNGTNMYLAGWISLYSPMYIFWYTLTTPWDLTTANFINKVEIRDPLDPSNWATTAAFCLSPDGQNLYYQANRSIYQFYLSTPWDITTMYFSGNSFYTEQYPIQIGFNPNGTKMYLYGQFPAVYINRFLEYTLSTPWDISSVVNSAGDAELHSYGSPFNFRPDGKVIYASNSSGDICYFDLPTPWSLSDYIYRGVCLNPVSILKAAGAIPTDPYYGISLENFVIRSDEKFAYATLYGEGVKNKIYIFTTVET